LIPRKSNFLEKDEFFYQSVNCGPLRILRFPNTSYAIKCSSTLIKPPQYTNLYHFSAKLSGTVKHPNFRVRRTSFKASCLCSVTQYYRWDAVFCLNRFKIKTVTLKIIFAQLLHTCNHLLANVNSRTCP
jgi:hypothetical protein